MSPFMSDIKAAIPFAPLFNAVPSILMSGSAALDPLALLRMQNLPFAHLSFTGPAPHVRAKVVAPPKPWPVYCPIHYSQGSRGLD